MKHAHKNIGPFLAFSPGWFTRHQAVLLWLLNSYLTRRWFRWVLRIRHHDCPLNREIIAIQPNHFTIKGEVDGQFVTDFRTHPKFAKRIYHAFKPLWWTLHCWDWLVADRFVPALSFGFFVLTQYPDAGTGSTTCDGSIYRLGSSESWATVRAGAGTEVYPSTDPEYWWYISTGASLTFGYCGRSSFAFDTAALKSYSVVDEAVLSVYGATKKENVGVSAGDSTAWCVDSAPATANTLVASDFANVGTTKQSDTGISYSSWSTSGYNAFPLNPAGIARISKTGISKYGGRSGMDLGTSSSATNSSATSGVACSFADHTGTTQDPKLVVTWRYGGEFLLLMIGGMAVGEPHNRRGFIGRVAALFMPKI